jgi:hypothetical protein
MVLLTETIGVGVDTTTEIPDVAFRSADEGLHLNVDILILNYRLLV